MKRLILVIMALVILIPVMSYASTIGNPETVGKGKFDVGIDGDYIFDRDLKTNAQQLRIDFDATSVGGPVGYYNYTSLNIEKPKINNMYEALTEASFGILNNLDMFVKLGAASGEIKENYSGTGDYWDSNNGPSALNITDGTREFRMTSGFTYGGGLKGTFDLGKGWLIGCSAQYLRRENYYKASDLHTETNGVGEGSQTYNTYSRWLGRFTSQEWQIAPYVAKSIGNFMPYLGVKYSDLRIEDKPNSIPQSYVNSNGEMASFITTQDYSMRYSSKHVVGPFVGLNYSIGKKWSINLEGSFVDETAVSLGGIFKF